MADLLHHSPDEPEGFAETREHEYQDPHYHDEDTDIICDDGARHAGKAPFDKKRAGRRMPVRRAYFDD